MKRFFGIFELSKNEQRVVLVVILLLITFAFVGYERRVHRPEVQRTAVVETKPSPSPAEIENEH
jgi:ABC-type Fe3+ transport system permease subunit